MLQSQVNLYLKELNYRYQVFLNYQTCIEDDNELELDSDIRIKVDKLLFQLKSALECLVCDLKLKKSTIICHENDLSFVPRLPELILTTYSGDITKWKSFFESFDNHVHTNLKLNAIYEFQYLGNSVIGFAAKIFENLDFVADLEARQL